MDTGLNRTEAAVKFISMINKASVKPISKLKKKHHHKPIKSSASNSNSECVKQQQQKS